MKKAGRSIVTPPAETSSQTPKQRKPVTPPKPPRPDQNRATWWLPKDVQAMFGVVVIILILMFVVSWANKAYETNTSWGVSAPCEEGAFISNNEFRYNNEPEPTPAGRRRLK